MEYVLTANGQQVPVIGVVLEQYDVPAGATVTDSVAARMWEYSAAGTLALRNLFVLLGRVEADKTSAQEARNLELTLSQLRAARKDIHRRS